MDGVKIGRNENWKEWKVKGMKIEMKMFSFGMFGWREKWEEWKYEKWDFYVLKLHL